MFTNFVISGRRQDVYYKLVDDFATFFHPKSKLVVSGIEEFIETDNAFISSPSRFDKN
jgi:hypothetical protein